MNTVMKDKIITVIKKSAIFLLTFLSMILLITTTLWIIKIPISIINLPIEFVLSIILFIIVSCRIKNKKNKEIDIEKCMLESWKTLLVSILLGTIVFSVSVYCLGKIYDTTQDGNTYHKLAVGSMKNGWNPLYGSCRDYTEEDGNVVTVIDGNRNYLWADHYAIGTEIIGANIYAFTGNIESGKVSSIIMIYICFGITLAYLSEDRKMKLLRSIIVAFVLSVNPITVTQIGTFYVDTALAMSLFIMFIELFKITHSQNENKVENYKTTFKNNIEEYLILGMSILICANAKLTGIAYSGVFCIAFYIYWLIKNRKDKKLLKSTFIINTVFYLIVLIVTIAIVGASSYLMNLIKHKSLFYPLSGENHVENMVNREIPESLSTKSHLEQFLTSIFSKGKNVSPAYYPEQHEEPEIKIPFTMTRSELKNYVIPDIRMGGFGPLYSGIFIISTITTIIAVIDFIKNKKTNQLIPYSIIVLISIGLVLGLDGGYWARYVPYVYFVSIMNLAYLFEKKQKSISIISYIIGIIILINSLSVSYSAFNGYISNSRYVNSRLKEFKEYSSTVQGKVEIKLNEFVFQGVEYNINDLGVKFKVNQNLQASRDGFLFKY